MSTIRDYLRKTPAKLPEPLWNLLRSHSPIRTAEEEQRELFKHANAYTVPESAFARTIDRALRACLALLKTTDHIKVEYVQGLTGNADVFYDKEQGTLKIHHRWLDFYSVHPKPSCRTSFPGNMDGKYAPFFCGHAVEELLTRSITSMFKASSMPWATEMRFMRHIRRLLRYMPHSIKLLTHKGGLLVTWEDDETEAIRQLGRGGPEYHVVLHEEKCSTFEPELLHTKAGKSAIHVL